MVLLIYKQTSAPVKQAEHAFFTVPMPVPWSGIFAMLLRQIKFALMHMGPANDLTKTEPLAPCS